MTYFNECDIVKTQSKTKASSANSWDVGVRRIHK